MSHTEVTEVKQRSLAKGIIAGVIGGVIGAVAMAVAERMFPARAHDEAEPVAKTVEGIRWGFGAAVGAAYGALAEFYPAATAKEGASFGMALETLTQAGALPASEQIDDPEDETFRERASETTSHVVYGVTTETVRGFLRKRL